MRAPTVSWRFHNFCAQRGRGRCGLQRTVRAADRCHGTANVLIKRLELLELLAQGDRSVEALAQAAGIRLTSVSAHLQVLKQAGIVTSRREGARVRYRLAGDDVLTLVELLQHVAHEHLTEASHARAVHLRPADTMPLTRQQLLHRMNSTNVCLIDVRPAEEYAAGHIPGARSLPLDELEPRLGELPEKMDLVAYGRSANCLLAQAVRLLTTRGHHALRLTDGILEMACGPPPHRSRTALNGIRLTVFRAMYTSCRPTTP
ncbi:metalloregulator ArsR/SmtB family transcription factor [Streptomyces sp. NPDC047860]|uniref:ArsR/SmtB family transcription factor n=1 Tax=Streptomyces sp. NPDC047860 TaxID=3155743 RepID=UPI003400AC30